MAISSESAKVLETACFDRTLNQVWFDKLSLTNQNGSAKLGQIPSIVSAGLLAPVLLNYRNEEQDSLKVCLHIDPFHSFHLYLHFRMSAMDRKSK